MNLVLFRRACLLALASACLFVALSAYRLTAQGAYYDELHQAAPAFGYQGRTPEMFARVSVDGIPVLNMTYSGAIKTAMYGVFLAATGRTFSLMDWRILGIALVTAGLLIFPILARAPQAPPRSGSSRVWQSSKSFPLSCC